MGPAIRVPLDGTEYVETAVTYVERNDWTVRMFALVTIVAAFFLMLAAATSGRSLRSATGSAGTEDRR